MSASISRRSSASQAVVSSYKFDELERSILRHKNIDGGKFDSFLDGESKNPRGATSFLELIRACCVADNFIVFRKIVAFIWPFEHLGWLISTTLKHNRAHFAEYLLKLDRSESHMDFSLFGNKSDRFHSFGNVAMPTVRYCSKRMPSVSEMRMLISHGIHLYQSEDGLDMPTAFVAETVWTDVERAIVEGINEREAHVPAEMGRLICSFVLSYSADPAETRQQNGILDCMKHKWAVLDAFLGGNRQAIKNSEFWISKILNDESFVLGYDWHEVETLDWFQTAVQQKLWNAAVKLLPYVGELKGQMLMSPVDKHLRKTILHDAVRSRGHSFVEALLKHLPREDVDAVDRNGNSALLDACEVGDATLVQMLLDHGADADLTNVWGTNALIRACAAPKGVTDESVLRVCRVLCGIWNASLSRTGYRERVNWVAEDIRLPGETALSCAMSRHRFRTASFLRAEGAV